VTTDNQYPALLAKLSNFLLVASIGADLKSKLNILRMYAIRKRHQRLASILSRFAPWSGQPLDLRIKINHRVLQIQIDPKTGDRPSFFEIFEELPRSLFELYPNPEIIIDGGANIGLFSLLSRAYFPNVLIHAFEPLPRNLEILKTHNQRNDAKIVVHGDALWNEAGEAVFHVARSNTSFLDKSLVQFDDLPDRIGVNCVRLDEAVPDLNNRRVMLKLDVEGAEIPILETVLPILRQPSIILCELHDNAHNQERFLQLFAQYQWQGKQLKNEGGHSYWCFVNHRPEFMRDAKPTLSPT
jgi:FkbM family methyltransferase